MTRFCHQRILLPNYDHDILYQVMFKTFLSISEYSDMAFTELLLLLQYKNTFFFIITKDLHWGRWTLSAYGEIQRHNARGWWLTSLMLCCYMTWCPSSPSYKNTERISDYCFEDHYQDNKVQKGIFECIWFFFFPKFYLFLKGKHRFKQLICAKSLEKNYCCAIVSNYRDSKAAKAMNDRLIWG